MLRFVCLAFVKRFAHSTWPDFEFGYDILRRDFELIDFEFCWTRFRILDFAHSAGRDFEF